MAAGGGFSGRSVNFYRYQSLAGKLGNDPVYAMEQAVSRLNSYYGVMEVYSENAQGEKWLVRGGNLVPRG